MAVGTPRSRQAALPLRSPGPVLALMAAAAAVLVTLGIVYAGSSSPGGVDRAIQAYVGRAGKRQFRPIDFALTLGDAGTVIVIVAVLAGICLLLGRRRLALLAVLGPGLTGLATTVLKPVFGRTLNGDWSYPSGHTGAATSVAIVVALLLVAVLGLRGWAAGVVVAVIALAAGVAMAVALIAGGVHYPTDTIGGFCTALVFVLGSALLIERRPTRPDRAGRSAQ